MATLRPHIIRADTLDLQDSEAPSAKDHSRQPSHPEPLGEGPAAPHQDAELRHVAEERNAEERYLANQMSTSFNNGGYGHHNADEFGLGSASITHMTNGQQGGTMTDGSAQQNGGDELDSGDSVGDDRLEDEAMDDKISSSPSIDDGGYYSFPQSRQMQPYAIDRHSSSMDESWHWLEHPFPASQLHQSHSPDCPAPASKERHPQGWYGEPSQAPQCGEGDSNNANQNISRRPLLRRVTTHIELRNRSTLPLIPVRNTCPVIDDEGFGENLVPEDEWDVEDRPAAAFQWPTGSSWNSSEDLSPDDQWGDPTAEVPLSPTSTSWVSSEDSCLESEWDEEDNSNAFYFSSDPRFIDSGWGGECLRDTEDIDFEFVYALHNFVATVEGQANATKGDTMVLLDDSNSYWWLVRIAKDNSIGYLPAEHIETPTERLARLNKHRNIDLSATMLGDNTERSKNPLKKAMRRRNAKIVAFSQPTYVEPPEVYWSDDDLELTESQTEENQGRRKGSQLDRIDNNGAETMQANGQITGQREGQSSDVVSNMEGRTGLSNEHTTRDAFDGQDDATDRTKPMRNTDSFYKDDSTGTKKISLTPDLLRDDSSRTHLRSPEPADRGASPEMFDVLGRISPGLDKAQEDKKRKDKKPNMLSGLFKRKDKKIKVDEAAGNIVARQDENGSTVFSPATSGRGSPSGRASPSTMLPQPSLRTPRSNANPLKSSLSATSSSLSTIKGQDKSQPLQGRKSPIANSDAGRTDMMSETRRDVTAPTVATERLVQFSNVHNDENSPVGAPMTRLRSPGPKYEPTNKLSEPIEVDVAASTSRPELNINTTLFQGPTSVISPMSTTAFSAIDSFDRQPSQISPVDAHEESHPPRQPEEMKMAETKMNFTNDTQSSDTPVPEVVKSSLEATPKSSTEDSVLSTSAVPESVTTPDSSSPAATPTTATPTGDSAQDDWDPVALAHYLDTDAIQDTKDMLSRVFNQIDVEPLPDDHPIMLEIGFHEVKAKLDAIGEELDTLLMDYLTRHGIDF